MYTERISPHRLCGKAFRIDLLLKRKDFHIRASPRGVPVSSYMNVCIFGASSSNIPECYIEFAEKLGHRLASDGHGMVFGAGRTGLMGAAARGAYSAGGKIIGVIPEKLNIPGIYFEHCTERIQTATMHERKQLMESRSDAFVALSGGFGTLEELLEVLTLKQLGYHNLPVIIVNINGFYDPLIAQFERCVAEGFTDKHFMNLFCSVTSIEAVAEALALPPREMPDKIQSVLSDSEKDAARRQPSPDA